MRRTKSTRTSIIVVLVCIALLLGGLAAWAKFLGNPVTMAGMKGNVLRYLHRKYPAADFTFIHAHYDFMNRTYSAGVRVTADPDLTFTVEPGQGRSYTDDYEERRLDHEATDALRAIVQATLPGATVTASVTLPAGQANSGAHFTAALGAATSAAIGWVDADATKESFVRTAGAVLDALRANGHNLSSCNLWCELGDREYALMLEGAQLRLGPDELTKLVLQPGKW